MLRKLRKSWESTWERTQGLRDPIPLSFTGALLGFAALGARQYWGIAQSDFVIRSAASLVLIIAAIMVISVIIAAMTLNRSISQLPDTSLVGSVEAGEVLADGLKFTRFRWWPFVQTDLEWQQPSTFEIKLQADGPDWLERIRPLERGAIERVTRRFTVRDIFGLASISMTRSWPAGIRVLPRRVAFDIEQVLREVAEDGFAHPSGQPIGDIIEMRRYAPGDPLNRIVWRTFARNRELYVREPERSISPLPTNTIYFVAGEGDERSAEFVRSMLEHGLPGDELTFGADGGQAPAYTRAGAMELLIQSAQYRHQGGQGLQAFAQAIGQRAGSRCIVCLPGKVGPWTAHLEGFVKMLGTPPTFLVSIEGEAMAHSPSQRWLWQTQSNAQVDGVALRQLHARLESMGGPVQVVNATAGRTVGRPEIIAMGQQ